MESNIPDTDLTLSGLINVMIVPSKFYTVPETPLNTSIAVVELIIVHDTDNGAVALQVAFPVT